MEKVKLYIILGLIVSVCLLTLTGCSSEQTVDHDGGTYTGKVKDGLPHGKGTWTRVDGQKYVGEFKDGMRYGKGTWTANSGDEYVGEWKADFMHGQGTFTFGRGFGTSRLMESRVKYVGEWKAGLPNGQGTMTYHDGREESGKWENGEYVGP
jgi:hypothetical protein